jgi:hypothetical protein
MLETAEVERIKYGVYGLSATRERLAEERGRLARDAKNGGRGKTP